MGSNRLAAITAPMTIVAIRFVPGFGERTFPAVRTLIDACRPDYSDHLPPDFFFARSLPGHEDRAAALVANVRELRRRHAHFAGLGAGTASGVVVYEHDRRGRVRSLPLGGTMNVAARAADADAAGR
jgi:class 3 adenylate cyclase